MHWYLITARTFYSYLEQNHCTHRSPSPHTPHFLILPLFLDAVTTSSCVCVCMCLVERKWAGEITTGAAEKPKFYLKVHFWKGGQKNNLSSTSLPKVLNRFHNVCLIKDWTTVKERGILWMKCSLAQPFKSLHCKPRDA